MPDLFGLDIAGIINDAFTGQLVSGTLAEVGVGTRSNSDPTGGRAQSETVHTFTDGVMTSYTDREINGTTIKAGDRNILIITGTLSSPEIEPEANWKVNIEDGKNWRIVIARRDPAAATWALQVRGE